MKGIHPLMLIIRIILFRVQEGYMDKGLVMEKALKQSDPNDLQVLHSIMYHQPQ